MDTFIMYLLECLLIDDRDQLVMGMRYKIKIIIYLQKNIIFLGFHMGNHLLQWYFKETTQSIAWKLAFSWRFVIIYWDKIVSELVQAG